MANLKLGKLPDRETTKITFTASAELKRLLEEYSALYEKTYGNQETVTNLIPFMLEAFIKSDVRFRKTLKANSSLKIGPAIGEGGQ
ncbi:MAG: DUF2274 domain-containing protein [Rhizobiaceae bacterium]|nr:DUF2274 domain-containing protein [Rhizobiaceae bacterium]